MKTNSQKKRPVRLVFAGGGTGGHLFPALALAEEFRRRDKDAEITFVGSTRGIEGRVVPGYGFPLILLNVEGLKRRSAAERIRAVAKAAKSTVEAVSILRRIRPDGVIGSGSYSSAPVVSAARILGIKTAILEQNALPGLTNKLLGKMVNRIYIAFEEARGHFPGGRTILTGNPVRKDILRWPGSEEQKDERFSILVFGGSQGATAVNTAFLDAAEYLTDIWPSLKVVHQSGEEGFEAVAASYRRKNLKVELVKFINDMATAYHTADLVVCRAGATSLAEITALGIASILIPYPFASDDHQSVNALCMSRKGAAIVIPQDRLTGSSLAVAIKRLYKEPAELKAMRQSSRAMGRPRAAEEIAQNFLKLIGRA